MVVFALGAREVDEATGIEQGRTRNADVCFLATFAVETIGLFAELGTAHDRIVAEDEPAVFDEARNGDELHRSDAFALLLIAGHE